MIVLLYWWRNLHFNVEQNKDPVGNGEGGVDDGDEEEADVLDLLLRLTLPHALHQLGHLEQHAGNGRLSCSHRPLPDDKEDGEDAEESPDVKVGDVGHLYSNADYQSILSK